LKKIYGLYIEFSFLPQVISSALIYRQVRFDSAVLLNTALRGALTAAFLEIALFSFLTIPKRFIITRIVLIAAYVQLLVTVFLFSFRWILYRHGTYHGMNTYLFMFCAIGIMLTILNLIALIKYRKVL